VFQGDILTHQDAALEHKTSSEGQPWVASAAVSDSHLAARGLAWAFNWAGAGCSAATGGAGWAGGSEVIATSVRRSAACRLSKRLILSIQSGRKRGDDARSPRLAGAGPLPGSALALSARPLLFRGA
jgi:hypothetical protein